MTQRWGQATYVQVAHSTVLYWTLLDASETTGLDPDLDFDLDFVPSGGHWPLRRGRTRPAGSWDLGERVPGLVADFVVDRCTWGHLATVSVAFALVSTAERPWLQQESRQPAEPPERVVSWGEVK
jgi:hypothetical protein